MTGSEPALHDICSWDEAASIVAGRDAFWDSNCGCRESRDGRSRSRIEVCLQVHPRTAAGQAGIHPLFGAEVDPLLSEAHRRLLVDRPFRGIGDRTVTEGICFCCDDCCGSFLNREERCDEGRLTAPATRPECNDCGTCVDVGRFGARSLDAGRLILDREECYRCGFSAASSRLDCTEMAERT